MCCPFLLPIAFPSDHCPLTSSLFPLNLISMWPNNLSPLHPCFVHIKFCTQNKPVQVIIVANNFKEDHFILKFSHCLTEKLL